MTVKQYREKPVLLIFLHYFKKHKGLFILDMLCAAAISGVDLAFPMVTRQALNRLLPDQLYVTFFTVIAVLLAAYVLRSLLQFIVSYYGHIFGVRVEADIREDLFLHIQDMSFDFFDANRTGQLMSRMTSDLNDLVELAHHGPEDLLICSLTIVGALVMMALIQWRLALLLGILIPILLAVILILRRRMSAASMSVKQKTGHISAEIESSLSGVRTAKAFANEEAERNRFRAANSQYRTAKREFYLAMAQFFSSMEFFICALNVAVVGCGGYLIMKGRMNYQDLLTFTLYISAFISPVRRISTLSETFANGMAGLRRFTQIMRTEPTVQDSPDAAELTGVKGEIRVEDVSFSYKPDVGVLDHVDLTVSAGETLAVVGPSGGGKTTLCQLIPRFYDVTEGAIRIDGQDVRQVTQHSLHRAIGIVQQDVFLFADTVRENIRYGKPDATDAEVEEAAKKAEIYEDILAMPDGFDTYVGERGTLLSGGQKQRVAIARIFLKDPPILILDEATSALDSVTEAKIQNAFDTLARGRTTLIIAHRLSTVRKAHRILSVAGGHVTECGTHEELLAKGGVYADLWNTQNGKKPGA